MSPAGGAGVPGGGWLRRLVRIDLPRRLARRLPRPLTEIAVGVAITLVFVAMRAVLAPVPDQLAPFALTFLALVIATLVAGWRAGLVTVLLGQGLIWYFLIEPRGGFGPLAPPAAYGLLLSTSVQLIIVLILGLYQREIRAGEIERARRINFLAHALREMDHRTKNHFQIVTSLLTLQANRSGSAEVKAALGEAAERLKAVAGVYDALAPSSQGLETVRLQDQLEKICGQIRRGIVPDGIELKMDLEPLLVPHERAVAIGIIVNELVTNACKHAFPDGRGTIRVAMRKEKGAALIEVADDGRGFAPGQAKAGLGTRLVGAFVQRVRGRSEVRAAPGEGTVHSIRVPLD